jgi:signal transduction histidine kinase/ActR/RegA family two-component response regulator
MAEPTTPAPPAAPDLLQREFLAERVQSSRRINLVRFIGISAFFALFVVLGGILEHPAWIGNLREFAAYWAITTAVFVASRRSARVAGLATLTIALVDIPMVFLLQWATFPTSPSPSGVAGFTLGIYVLLLLLAALSLERRVVYFTAAVAAVFEVALQYLADVSVGGMISTVIVLGLAAVTVLYSRTRLVKLVGGVERELAEQRRMASLGTLAAGVAHEINTPLTYVVANLALMSERLAALSARPGPSASTSILVDRLKAIEQRVHDLGDANREVVERIGTKLTGSLRHDFGNAQTFILHTLSKASDELAALMLETRDGQVAASGAAIESIDALLGEAREGAERVRTIVRDLKTFSRSDEATVAAVDLWRPLRTAMNLVAAQVNQKARLRTERGAAPLVLANEARLGQVFVNLLVNAVQAIPAGDPETNEICVATTTDEEGRGVVEVRDTGAGISPEIMPRLFDPFFTTKPVGEGTGLGLAICHGIISTLGGELTVESEVGKGTTFRVALPASTLPAVAPAATAAATTATRAIRRARILLVDDDPGIGRVVRESLGADHDLTTLTSGSDALARLRAGERFDLIFCDVMMPSVTGMDVHEELSRIAPEQAGRMIFLSGGAFTPRTVQFVSEMSDRLLDKPFDVAQLRAAVHTRLTAPVVA